MESSLKPHKLLENAQTPTSRPLQAVLGSVLPTGTDLLINIIYVSTIKPSVVPTCHKNLCVFGWSGMISQIKFKYTM